MHGTNEEFWLTLISRGLILAGAGPTLMWRLRSERRPIRRLAYALVLNGLVIEVFSEVIDTLITPHPTISTHALSAVAVFMMTVPLVLFVVKRPVAGRNRRLGATPVIQDTIVDDAILIDDEGICIDGRSFTQATVPASRDRSELDSEGMIAHLVVTVALPIGGGTSVRTTTLSGPQSE